MWAAIVAFFKVFGPLIIKFIELGVGLIEYVQKFVIMKAKRLSDANQAEIDARKKAKEEQYMKETSNVKAFKLIEEEAWKDRHKTILNFIKQKQYENVLKLVKKVDDEVINSFLFDTEMDDEYKALKIIKIMQRKES